MPKRPTGETLRHFEAFEFWFWLQPRSLDKVASEFRVTDRAVREWAAKFRWDERAQEREDKLKTALSDRADAKAINLREKLLKIGEATLARYAARLLKDPGKRAEQGVTAYEPNAADAARWAQMQLLLTGQATSRTDVTLGAGFVDAFLQTMGAVLRREVPRCCPTCKTDLQLPEKIGLAMVEASRQLAASENAPAPQPPIIAAPGRGENPDDAGELP